MKQLGLWTVTAVFLLTVNGFAQVSPPDPLHPLLPDALIQATLNPVAFQDGETLWRQDSTWESNWNAIASDWKRNRRILRSFNGCGNLLTEFILQWNTSLSEWINQESRTITYHSDNTLPASIIYRIWDQSLLQWIEILHMYYNEEGDMTERETKTYDPSTGAFLDGIRTVITYSSTNTVEIREQLDPVTMDWLLSLRITTDLNEQGDPVSSLVEVYSCGTWVNMQYLTISYISPGKQQEIINHEWDAIASMWKKSYRLVYDYNSLEWRIGYYFDLWDQVLLVWQPSMKILYQFDEFGNETSAYSSEWDNALMVWVPSQKMITTWHAGNVKHQEFRSMWLTILGAYKEIQYRNYDSDGNLLEDWSKGIDYSTGEYTNGVRSVKTYSDGLLSETVNQSLEIPSQNWLPAARQTHTYDGNRNRTVDLYQNWDDILMDWVNSWKRDHFYSSFIGIEEISSLTDLCVFANPLKRGESIRCQSLSPDVSYRVSLYSPGGQRLSDQEIRGGESLILPETLSPGIYLLVITGNDTLIATGKVVLL